MLARDNLSERPGSHSEFAAIHRIEATADVFNFFAKATSFAKEILIANHDPIGTPEDEFDLGPTLEIEGLETPTFSELDTKDTKDTGWFDQDQFYQIYDHSDVWVGILEASASRRKAIMARKILQANDVGNMKQEACDAVAKIPNKSPMTLVFDRVMPVGNKQPNGKANGMQNRLALVPDLEASTETVERLYSEYFVVTNFLMSRFPQTFLSDKYIPFAEFMTFRRESTHADISKITEGINGILADSPLKVSLRELEFPQPKLRLKHKK